MSTLPKEKKLTVLFRVEAGCLGPTGEQYVDGFCPYAQSELGTRDAEFIDWLIVPRDDKRLPEMEYRLNGKRLNRDQAARYLALFGKSLDEFEGHHQDRIVVLIEQYLNQ